MTFWQENYAFIKDVYDMRHTKMAEWMENVEKVCYIHAGFRIRIRIRFSSFLDPDLDPVSAKILENCRKVSKSDLSEENLKFMTRTVKK